MIQDVIDLHSANADLFHARDAGLALVKLRSRREKDEAAHDAITNALIDHMIILYVRATKTTQAARKTFDIRPKMTDEQREQHRQICDLRDKSVAHFGTGGSYDGGTLMRETAYMKPVKGDMKFGVVTRRVREDPLLALRLIEQIDVALDIFEQMRGKKQQAVVDTIVGFDPGDELWSLLQNFPFDAEVFFGNSAEAAAFYAAPIMDRRSRPIINRDYEKWLPDRDAGPAALGDAV